MVRPHHPRKYMTKHREDIVYVFSCCGDIRHFVSRAGRDKAANQHEVEHRELLATIKRESGQ